MTDTTLAITDLRSRWFKLVDLDRAQEIEFIHRLGVSLQELATALNCSPSLLTHLLQAARASIEDRELARRGVLSTRALVQRAKAHGARSTAMNHEEIAFARERTALQGSKSILNWLEEQQVTSADQGRLIENTRLHLSYLERAGLHHQLERAAALSTDQIDVQSMLARPRPEEVDPDAGLAQRFALWVFHGIPDAPVRQRAFELTHGELDLRCGCATLSAGKIAAPFPGSMAIAA
jgi:hypothetical protein